MVKMAGRHIGRDYWVREGLESYSIRIWASAENIASTFFGDGKINAAEVLVNLFSDNSSMHYATVSYFSQSQVIVNT